MKRPVKKEKTITWDELCRLAFTNSPKLPQRVIVHGRLKEWVGIGWMDCGPAEKGYVRVSD